MKKCDHFKDLILTDYIDGELDKNVRESLEGHLLSCRDCQAFVQEVKNNAVSPFQKACRQPVPVEIWQTIREDIEQEYTKQNPLEDFIERLKGLVFVPRFIPVFASVILMFLVGSVALNTIQINQAKEKDQGEYLVALLDSTGPSGQADSSGLETSIEHYFL